MALVDHEGGVLMGKLQGMECRYYQIRILGARIDSRTQPTRELGRENRKRDDFETGLWSRKKVSGEERVFFPLSPV